jgi:glycosyltransferase involved in cell wall biosynthesis
VIVPALNEGDRIASTVRALWACGYVGQVVVVDDGSRDETASEARAAGASVFQHSRRCGKGAALQSGLGLAERDWVAFIDGDLASSAGCISTLAEPVLLGEFDVAIARMPFPGGLRGFGLVMGLSRWAVRRFGGLELSNPLCGQRVMSKDTALRLLPMGHGYAIETRSAIVFGRLGLTVTEVPLPIEHRRSGRDLRGILHRAAQLRDVAVESLRWALGLQR